MTVLAGLPTPDATHDPRLRAWIESANRVESEFPIQNLPLGVFRRAAGWPAAIGVAIGDLVLDLHAVAETGLLDGLGEGVVAACRADALNPLLELGPSAWVDLRVRLSALLRADAVERAPSDALVPQAAVELLLPARVSDYTDFYASIHHATNVGRLFRPEHPLLPNYKWVPIGYHGRASSLVPSGTAVRRPRGQRRGEGMAQPEVGFTRQLDYELEVGCLIGPGNPLGQPIPISQAGRHIFGLCLLNDWSARDIQQWESQPLGPFLSKSFATTVSPWVVTTAALAPFRTPAARRPPDDPPPLPYLLDPEDQASGGFAVTLEAYLQTEQMRQKGLPPHRLSRSALAQLYWTPAQLVAHHTSNGCNLRPGDLLATGTVSGEASDARGCLLELTRGGADPVQLPSGESRRFLEDGDEIVLRGRCDRDGWVSIGFGECRGRIVP